MRRALLRRLPALTQFYGIQPRDVEDMTAREVVEYLRQYDQHQAENRG